MDNLTSPGGVLDLIKTCRAMGLAGDPKFLGNNQTVNDVCTEALLQSLAVIGASDAFEKRTYRPASTLD